MNKTTVIVLEDNGNAIAGLFVTQSNIHLLDSKVQLLKDMYPIYSDEIDRQYTNFKNQQES